MLQAASHAAPWLVTVSLPTGQTDGRTPDRCITLSARRGHMAMKRCIIRD